MERQRKLPVKQGNGEAAFQMTSYTLAYLSEKIKFIKSSIFLINRFVVWQQ
jgi:hypothetical protein